MSEATSLWQGQDIINYDPLALEEDPYPVYSRLREEAPLYQGHNSAGRFWALSRFDDVRAAARDWQRFSSAQGNDLDETGLLFGPAPAMDLGDPPTHTRQREAVKHAFHLSVVRAQLEPRARRKVKALLKTASSRPSLDLAREIAYPLPAGMICDWLGFPEKDQLQLREWHFEMLHRNPGEAALPHTALGARDSFWEYLERQIDERRTETRDDLLSVLVTAENGGVLSHDEVLANALFFFDAGIVSTSALIANSFLYLNRFGDQREALWQSAELIPAAVEELLRFDAPFHWFTRVSTESINLHGAAVPAGERFVLIWASANRDERRWENADRLILDRPPRRHLSFSDGIHHCLGLGLARMEVRILFEEMIPLVKDYRILGPVRRRVTPSERTIESLPAEVTWT